MLSYCATLVLFYHPEQNVLSFCALYGVHRANTMYCSFTNQMLKVTFHCCCNTESYC